MPRAGKRALIPAAAAAALLLSMPAQSRRAQIVELKPLPGGTHSAAYAVNERGQVVGTSSDAEGHYHAVLWERGRVRDLGVLPGGEDSFARGINDRGQVVGESTTLTESGFLFTHAFRWKGGRLTDLGVLPGASASIAHAVDREGRVVGHSDTSSGTLVAVEWRKGKVRNPGADAPFSLAFGGNEKGHVVGRVSTDGDPAGGRVYTASIRKGSRTRSLPTLPDGEFSCAYAVDESGVAVGESETGTTDAAGFKLRHAVRWNGSRIVDLGTLPGGSLSAAYGLNRRGQVVGFSDDAAGTVRAALWKSRTAEDLNARLSNDSGWLLNIAYGISDRGEVVGTGRINGETHGFVLKLR